MVGILDRAERVGGEEEGVAAVVEGVDVDLDLVPFAQLGVALQLARADPAVVAVEGPDAEVDPPLVVEDAELGPLGGGIPEVGLTLDEPALRLRELPDLVVEAAVDPGRRAFRQPRRDGAERFGIDPVDVDEAITWCGRRSGRPGLAGRMRRLPGQYRRG